MDWFLVKTNPFLHSNALTSLSNPQLDSVSLSGAVGTALYVAPELLVPFTKNKFFYTQVRLLF